METNKHVTEKGTILYWEVVYDKGGMNFFTSHVVERGFYLIVKRSKHEISMFSDLSSKSGAISFFLHSVGRYSEKQRNIAMDMALPVLNEIIEHYNL